MRLSISEMSSRNGISRLAQREVTTLRGRYERYKRTHLSFRTIREIEAWQRKRHAASKTMDWQFTTAEARVKLKRLYPVICNQDVTNY